MRAWSFTTSVTFGALAAVSATAAPAEAPSLRIEDAAARVLVIPEARKDIAVAVQQRPGLKPLKVRRVGPDVVVAGELKQSWGGLLLWPSWGCTGRGGVRVGGRALRQEDLPLVVARVPLDARVAAGGMVFGEVRRSSSLALANAGCGDWRVADVDGAAEFTQTGSGSVVAGAAGSTRARVAGSGDLVLGKVSDAALRVSGSGSIRAAGIRGRAEAVLTGSGNIRADRVDGPLDATVTGSGDVEVASGFVPVASLTVTGSGDVTFGGEAGELRARVTGSGDVEVARVRGRVDAAERGSGDIRIAQAGR